MIYSDWSPSMIKQLKISFEDTLKERMLHDNILKLTTKPPPKLGENRRLAGNRISAADVTNEI